MVECASRPRARLPVRLFHIHRDPSPSICSNAQYKQANLGRWSQQGQRERRGCDFAPRAKPSHLEWVALLAVGTDWGARRAPDSGPPAQVMEDESCVRMVDGRPLEAVITEKLRHPALVAALGHASAPSRDAHDPRIETWLLLEFCDCGSLIVRALAGR